MRASLLTLCVIYVLIVTVTMVTDARRPRGRGRYRVWGWWRKLRPLFVGKRSGSIDFEIVRDPRNPQTSYNFRDDPDVSSMLNDDDITGATYLQGFRNRRIAREKKLPGNFNFIRNILDDPEDDMPKIYGDQEEGFLYQDQEEGELPNHNSAELLQTLLPSQMSCSRDSECDSNCCVNIPGDMGRCAPSQHTGKLCRMNSHDAIEQTGCGCWHDKTCISPYGHEFGLCVTRKSVNNWTD